VCHRVKLGVRNTEGAEVRVAVKILDGDGRKFDEVRKEIAVHKVRVWVRASVPACVYE
jgi:hypothetical protein